VSSDATPFWEGCARRELVLPFCTACDEFFFYPRTLCPGCGAREIEWRPVSGRGRLHAFCIHHVTPLKGFQVPFVTILVELDEGPRMMSLLHGVEPDPALIRCDMPLRVEFTGDGVPVFVPAG
jgi:uncharacterized OB-fold protein